MAIVQDELVTIPFSEWLMSDAGWCSALADKQCWLVLSEEHLGWHEVNFPIPVRGTFAPLMPRRYHALPASDIVHAEMVLSAPNPSGFPGRVHAVRLFFDTSRGLPASLQFSGITFPTWWIWHLRLLDVPLTGTKPFDLRTLRGIWNVYGTFIGFIPVVLCFLLANFLNMTRFHYNPFAFSLISILVLQMLSLAWLVYASYRDCMKEIDEQQAARMKSLKP